MSLAVLAAQLSAPSWLLAMEDCCVTEEKTESWTNLDQSHKHPSLFSLVIFLCRITKLNHSSVYACCDITVSKIGVNMTEMSCCSPCWPKRWAIDRDSSCKTIESWSHNVISGVDSFPLLSVTLCSLPFRLFIPPPPSSSCLLVFSGRPSHLKVTPQARL